MSRLQRRVVSNPLPSKALDAQFTRLSAADRPLHRTISYRHNRLIIPQIGHGLSNPGWHAIQFSTNTKDKMQTEPQPSDVNPSSKRRITEDIQEYNKRAAAGTTATFDRELIAAEQAKTFPRIKTTSLSTKRIVIHDEALTTSVTLVMVAFRSFADGQLQSWRHAFESGLPAERVQWYDVTINESFGARALSGFIQRLQRGRTDPWLHDYYVAFNSRAREPLEVLLPSVNRMFGYALLLDRQARVRFRASGMATQDGLETMLRCAKELIAEDERESQRG